VSNLLRFPRVEHKRETAECNQEPSVIISIPVSRSMAAAIDRVAEGSRQTRQQFLQEFFRQGFPEAAG
jgi:hypothetical protein